MREQYYPYGVQILSLGAGASVTQAADWRTINNLHFPVLADPTFAVCQLFGDTLLGFSAPWDVIIGTDHLLAYSDNSYNYQTQTLEIEDLIAVFEQLFDPITYYDPDTLNFGQVEVGQTADLTFLLDNLGTGVLVLNDITSTSTLFSASPTQDSIFAVDDSLMVMVAFAPDQEGDYEADITLVTSAGSFPVHVSGSAISTGVLPTANVPREFSIRCYPNPFNAELSVQIVLDHAQDVSADLYTIRGDQIGEIYSGHLHQGTNELRWSDEQAPSGIYLLKVTGAGWSSTQKVVLVR